MRRYRPIIILFTLLAASYIAELLLLPTHQQAINRLQLGKSTETLVSSVLLFPVLAIWFAAVLAFIRFKRYAQAIAASKDGRSLLIMANGIFFLALWLPLTAILNNITTYFYHLKPHRMTEFIIAKDSFNALLLLVAFAMIWYGSRQLVATLQTRELSNAREIAYRVLFIAIFLIYAVIVVHAPRGSILPTGTDYAPGPVFRATLLLLHAAVWYMGLFGIRNIRCYMQNSRGIIYKEALSYLSWGVILIIGALLGNRFILALSSWFNGLTMRYAFAIFYGLIGLLGVGCIFIIQGTKRLHQIEEA